MTSPLLDVRDLHVSYGQVQALRGVSLRVEEGALVALVGANGAGKSTLLAAVCGLVSQRAGRVSFRGNEITALPSHRRVAAGLVLVPEGREILAQMSVEENLKLGAWHQQQDFDAGLKRVFERFPILEQRRAGDAGSLSGGEQQMLAIARALLARPRLLLMDEPSMGLAPLLVDEVFRVIDAIRREGTTILLVEQNARRALTAADYGYVIETGEVVLEGPADELVSSARVIEAYLGETVQ